MAREIDWAGLAECLHIRRRRATLHDIMAVMKATQLLRRSRLPEAYVDGIQDELLHMICVEVPGGLGDSIYLAFHGAEDRASHMKIGVAKNVKRRMDALYTGNPLPRLWVFAAPVAGRKEAMRVERALLDHMSDARTSGEWVSVGGLSFDAAAAVASSLGEVGAATIGQTVKFSPVEV